MTIHCPVTSYLDEGTPSQIIQWAEEDYHYDFTNQDTVKKLSANALMAGMWRHTELENIAEGSTEKDIDGEPLFNPDGLNQRINETEMRIFHIGATKIIANYIQDADETGEWITGCADSLTDPDQYFGWTDDNQMLMLSDKIDSDWFDLLKKDIHTAATRFQTVQTAVGLKRFFLGTALCAAENFDWGSPIWDTMVDEWANQGSRSMESEFISKLKTDPTTLVDFTNFDLAVVTGLGPPVHSKTKITWCSQFHKPVLNGNTYQYEHPGNARRFMRIGAHIGGLPMGWALAAETLLNTTTQKGIYT